MPVYEFRCQQCKQTFTVRTSWRDKDKTVCPKCGSLKLQQLFTSINVLGGGNNSCSLSAANRFT